MNFWSVHQSNKLRPKRISYKITYIISYYMACIEILTRWVEVQLALGEYYVPCWCTLFSNIHQLDTPDVSHRRDHGVSQTASTSTSGIAMTGLWWLGSCVLFDHVWTINGGFLGWDGARVTLAKANFWWLEAFSPAHRQTWYSWSL